LRVWGLRLKDLLGSVTRVKKKAQGPSSICNESKEEGLRCGVAMGDAGASGTLVDKLCAKRASATSTSRADISCAAQQPLYRNVQRFRGGLVFEAHRLCVSLNSRFESNKEEEDLLCRVVQISGFGVWGLGFRVWGVRHVDED